MEIGFWGGAEAEGEGGRDGPWLRSAGVVLSVFDSMFMRLPFPALVALGLTVACVVPTCGDFVPIALTSTSYNQDVVVEKTAAVPVISGGYSTASMDGGLANSAASFRCPRAVA